MKTLTVRGEGVVLDAILNAEFGAVDARKLLSATLELNPGLAALGPVLPFGTVLNLPDRPAATTPRPLSVVSLNLSDPLFSSSPRCAVLPAFPPTDTWNCSSPASAPRTPPSNMCLARVESWVTAPHCGCLWAGSH